MQKSNRRNIWISKNLFLFCGMLIIFSVFSISLFISGWLLMIPYPQSRLFFKAPFFNENFQLPVSIIVFLLFFLMMVLSYLWHSKKIQKLIHHIEEVSEQVLEGNEKATLRFRKGDSFDFFSDSFNKMVSSFNDRKNKIQSETQNLIEHLEKLPSNPSPKDIEKLESLLG